MKAVTVFDLSCMSERDFKWLGENMVPGSESTIPFLGSLPSK